MKFILFGVAQTQELSENNGMGEWKAMKTSKTTNIRVDSIGFGVKNYASDDA